MKKHDCSQMAYRARNGWVIQRQRFEMWNMTKSFIDLINHLSEFYAF